MANTQALADSKKRQAVELLAALANYRLGGNRPRVAKGVARNLVGNGTTEALSAQQWQRLATVAEYLVHLIRHRRQLDEPQHRPVAAPNIVVDEDVTPPEFQSITVLKRGPGRPRKRPSIFQYTKRDDALRRARLNDYDAAKKCSEADEFAVRTALRDWGRVRLQGPDEMPLEDWLKLGAALVIDREATYVGAKNTFPRFHRHFGLCARSGCDRFFFLTGRGECLPKFCSPRCRKTAGENARHREATKEKRQKRAALKRHLRTFPRTGG